MIKRLLLFTVLFLSVSALCFAQPGTVIKGNITDKSTGEPLIGATAILKSKTKPTLATATGLDGSFAFRNITAGDYEIEFKYIGYKKAETHISIQAGESRYIKLGMEPSGTAGLSEVKITGKVDKESDRSAIQTVQRADQIMNAVSARTIEVSPDITVANVMQRISGVSIERSNNGEGQHAIIRGMDKRYTYTLINGFKIPSPDNKNRYIPLDIFPADIIERLEVFKTLTPSMEGDAIGGAINMVLKEAPDQFTVKANLGTSLSQSVLDHGFTSFGANNVSLRSPRIINGDNYNATISDFSNNGQHFKNSKSPLGTIGNLSIGGRAFDDKFGVLLSGSYQDIYKDTKGVYFDTSVPDNQNRPLVSDIITRFYSTEQKRTSLIGRFDYRFNQKNKLNFDASYIDLAQNQYRFTSDTALTLQRTGIGQGRITQSPRSIRNVQNIYNFSLHGDHQLADKLSMNWTAIYSKATAEENRYSLSLNTARTLNTSNGVVTQAPLTIDAKTGGSQTFAYNSDQDKSGYLNFVYTPQILGTKVEFTAGGMYRNKTRNSTYDSYTFVLPITNATQVYDGNIDNNTFQVSTPQGTAGDALNYNFTENIGAGFGQFKFVIGKLETIGGLRWEHTSQSFADALDPTFLGRTGSIKYYDLLPSVNFKYKLDDKQNIRASYYSAISRPNFYELVPHTTGDPDADYQEVGNPDLKHATADNYDLRYEFFPKAFDQFLAGVFYKDIQNPIEYALQNSALGFVSKPGNFGTAHNYGFELDATKYIHSFGIRANYTFTQSNITTTKQQRYQDANLISQVAIVNQTRPLQGQSKNIANLSFLYKDAKSGTDAQISAVYTGERINSVSAYLNNDIWQKGFVSLDVSAEKRLYKALYIYAKATNLLNTPYQLFVKLPYPPVGQFGASGQPIEYQTSGQNTFVRKDNYGQYYILGVHYKF